MEFLRQVNALIQEKIDAADKLKQASDKRRQYLLETANNMFLTYEEFEEELGKLAEAKTNGFKTIKEHESYLKSLVGEYQPLPVDTSDLNPKRTFIILPKGTRVEDTYWDKLFSKKVRKSVNFKK